MERVRILNAKGQGIAAVIHPSEARIRRLVILCPGYLDTKDYAHLVALAEALHAEGYTVVRFDPTGTWESEGDISEYTTTQYLSDIGSVLDHMLQENAYEHILLGGHSRGGQVSILYAARDPRISTVLGIMPSSLPVTGGRRETWKEAGVSIGQRELPDDSDARIEFRVPFDHVLDRDQYDTLADVQKIQVSLLLMAGEVDVLSPPEDVRRIFDLASEPKKLIVIEGIGHEYRHNLSEIAKVNQAAIDALRQS